MNCSELKIGDRVVVGVRKKRAPDVAVIEGRDAESVSVYGLPFPLDTGMSPDKSIWILRVATADDIATWYAAQLIRAAEEQERAARMARGNRTIAALQFQLSTGHTTYEHSSTSLTAHNEIIELLNLKSKCQDHLANWELLVALIVFAMTLAKHIQVMFEDDGALLLDLRRSRYYSVNAIGAEILRLIEQSKNREEIVSMIGVAYRISPEDVDIFMRKLLDMGMQQN